MFLVAKLESGRDWFLKHNDSKFEQSIGDHDIDDA